MDLRGGTGLACLNQACSMADIGRREEWRAATLGLVDSSAVGRANPADLASSNTNFGVHPISKHSIVYSHSIVRHS